MPKTVAFHLQVCRSSLSGFSTQRVEVYFIKRLLLLHLGVLTNHRLTRDVPVNSGPEI